MGAAADSAVSVWVSAQAHAVKGYGRIPVELTAEVIASEPAQFVRPGPLTAPVDLGQVAPVLAVVATKELRRQFLRPHRKTAPNPRRLFGKCMCSPGTESSQWLDYSHYCL
jgi:hypothetical protein